MQLEILVRQVLLERQGIQVLPVILVLQVLLEQLPDMSVVDGASSIEVVPAGDQPILRSAQLVEGGSMRAIRPLP